MPPGQNSGVGGSHCQINFETFRLILTQILTLYKIESRDKNVKLKVYGLICYIR